MVAETNIEQRWICHLQKTDPLIVEESIVGRESGRAAEQPHALLSHRDDDIASP